MALWFVCLSESEPCQKWSRNDKRNEPIRYVKFSHDDVVVRLGRGREHFLKISEVNKPAKTNVMIVTSNIPVVNAERPRESGGEALLLHWL